MLDPDSTLGLLLAKARQYARPLTGAKRYHLDCLVKSFFQAEVRELFTSKLRGPLPGEDRVGFVQYPVPRGADIVEDKESQDS